MKIQKTLKKDVPNCVFSVPPSHQDFLEEAPMSWDALVKKTFRKKEEILPMQMAEVRRILSIKEGHHPNE